MTTTAKAGAALACEQHARATRSAISRVRDELERVRQHVDGDDPMDPYLAGLRAQKVAKLATTLAVETGAWAVLAELTAPDGREAGTQ
jgi:hypothetical protein